MIIKKNKTYEICSLYPNTNWTGDGYYIIDETTEEGRQMAQIYIENHPFVDFEHDGEFVTEVIVLEGQKQIELARLEQEQFDKESLDALIPSEREILMAEVEIQTITILMEVGLI